MESETSAAPVPHATWARAPLFRGLSEADLEAITGRTSIRQFTAGDVLIRQSVWCGQLFIVRDGVVQVSVERGDTPGEPSRGVPLMRMVEGDILGEMSLITGAPPSATAYALTDGQALVLPQEDFLQLALELPMLSRNINAILSDRLRRSNVQKVETRPQQIVVCHGDDAALWQELAGMVARLIGHPVLLIDLTGSGTSESTLADLVGGRLGGSAREGEARVTHVNGTGEGSDNLASLLGRVGDEYRQVLVAVSDVEQVLSSQLLAFASRVLVTCPIDDPARVRTLVERIASSGSRHEVEVVVTDAPPSLVPSVSAQEMLERRMGAAVVAILPADPEERRPRLRALGRRLVGHRVGIALGAGGAKGWAHIGAVRALLRAGVPFDCVTGVSIGAIVGAATAMGRSTEWIEAAFGQSMTRIFRPAFPFYGVLTNRALGRWYRKEIYGETLIEDTPIPLALTAADLDEGSEIVLRHGLVYQAVLASSAIPGIYPAVKIGGHYLVDGGVVNPVPVATARLLGADIVIAIDLSVPLTPRHELDEQSPVRSRPPHIFNNMLRSRDIMMSVIQQHSLAEPSVLVKPQVEGISLRNFRQGARFLTAGEQAMEEALPLLRQQLPWLGTEM